MKLAEKQEILSPFGAQLTPEGVRFRLWAPKARSVDVVFGGQCLPLEGAEEGWFELTTPRASAGTLYRFRIDGQHLVPDPASRFQPQDVDGPSEVVDPSAFRWQAGWRGRPWREAVIY